MKQHKSAYTGTLPPAPVLTQFQGHQSQTNAPTQSQQSPGSQKRFRSPLLTHAYPAIPVRHIAADGSPMRVQEQVHTECQEQVHAYSQTSSAPNPASDTHSRPLAQAEYGGEYYHQARTSTTSHRHSKTRSPVLQTQNANYRRKRKRTPSPPTALDTRASSPPAKRAPQKYAIAPSPPRSRTTFDSTRPDAYAFEPDPDEAWSTLPVRKKPVPLRRNPGTKTSGKFRMPLNLSGKGASGVNSKEQGKINEKVQGGRSRRGG